MVSTLTIQQRRFAEGRVLGMTGIEAVAYAGYKSKAISAEKQATRMSGNVGVNRYIEMLREESRSSSVKTAQEVKELLSKMMDYAVEKRDFTGFVSLAARLAKMDGHDEPERMKVDFVVTIGGDD